MNRREYPEAPDVKHPRVQDYLIEKLKAPAAKRGRPVRLVEFIATDIQPTG